VLAAALRDGGWNIGGERIWLAPERLFNFTDPDRMIETYRVDPALDPGDWQLEQQGPSLLLSLVSEVALASGEGRIGVRIERRLSPLGAIPGDAGMAVTGYRQSVEVRQTGGVPLPVVPWIVRQVAPGGTAFVSASGPRPAARVFGDLPDSALTARDGFWSTDFAGTGFYKTAYDRHAVGRGHLGYLRPGGRDAAVAILYRPVQADPAAYPEALPHDTGATGQAASLFYDSGRFGAYGELELYGYRDPAGAGVLTTDCLVLRGRSSGLRDWMGLPRGRPSDAAGATGR
jgi:hypothetical protein